MESLLRNRDGITLVELMVTMGIMSLVIFGGAGILVNSSRSSAQIQTQSNIDSDVALAAEKLNHLLMETRSVTIDSNGLGLTYKLPPTNSDGAYISSAKELESTVRRIYLSGADLVTSVEPGRPILQDIPTIDPDTKTTLRIFQSGVGGKEIIIRLVSGKQATAGAHLSYSILTTRINCRNIQ